MHQLLSGRLKEKFIAILDDLAFEDYLPLLDEFLLKLKRKKNTPFTENVGTKTEPVHQVIDPEMKKKVLDAI